MRHVGNVCNSLNDARDWVMDSSEELDEIQERLHLEKARTAILWAERQIAARLVILESRRMQHEEAKPKEAYRAWCKEEGQGNNLRHRRPEGSA